MTDPARLKQTRARLRRERALRGYAYRCTFPKCGAQGDEFNYGPLRRCPNFIFKNGNRVAGCGR